MRSSSASYPEGSMKSLMEAVAQVTNGPGPILYAYSQPKTPNSFVLPGTRGMIEPLPFQSAPINNIVGMPFINQGGPLRKRKHRGALGSESISAAKKATAGTSQNENDDKRSKRLEQNRLAAVESRRRKKHMVEELQRSVQYYSKANATLKSQNAELERQLLLATQNTLSMNQEKAESQEAGDNLASASANVSIQEVSTTDMTPPKKPKREAAIVHVSRPYSALIGSTSNTAHISGMENQAQQAQFAATQALYKSRGYPAGAARVAANTFSQYICQTGSVPVLSPTQNEVQSPETVAAISEVKKLPKIESDDAAYIQALNRFAMQQAAAANAAAAAATAAIQAANLHEQIKNKKNGVSSSIIQALPAMSYPAVVPWSCQNQASSTKKV